MIQANGLASTSRDKWGMLDSPEQSLERSLSEVI